MTYPADTPLWMWMATVTGLGCWILSAVLLLLVAVHTARERIAESRGTTPSPDRMHAMFPDAWTREEDSQ